MQRYDPSDPREWLNRARANLERAGIRTPNSYFEDLCFDAQQAAEKAVKAVLVQNGVDFPYIHDLERLLTLVENTGVKVPEEVRAAEALTRYAIVTRYPGVAEPVSEQEHGQALKIAGAVVDWAGAVIRQGRPELPSF